MCFLLLCEGMVLTLSHLLEAKVWDGKLIVNRTPVMKSLSNCSLKPLVHMIVLKFIFADLLQVNIRYFTCFAWLFIISVSICTILTGDFWSELTTVPVHWKAVVIKQLILLTVSHLLEAKVWNGKLILDWTTVSRHNGITVKLLSTTTCTYDCTEVHFCKFTSNNSKSIFVYFTYMCALQGSIQNPNTQKVYNKTINFQKCASSSCVLMWYEVV